MRQRFHEYLAIGDPHHCIGDVLEELYEVPLWVRDRRPINGYLDSERSDSGSHLHNHLSLPFTWLKGVPVGCFACAAGDAYVAIAKVALHVVSWHCLVIVAVEVVITHTGSISGMVDVEPHVIHVGR